MKKIKFFPLFAMLFLAAANVFSQSQATSGNIEGRVTDPNGAVVPGVGVTATNIETGFERSTSSDEDGNYKLILLPPGKYKLVAKAAQGFRPTEINDVAVTVGGKTYLEIAMSVGGHTITVDISDDGSIEATRSSISSTVDEKRVSGLPTNGRNFLDFVTLTPGIVRDQSRAGDLAVGGQKGTMNSLQIDGASNDNTFFGQSSGRTGSGRAPSQFSIDTVKEFQVNQNGFSAEYGRAAGAVINVITKSGKNTFFGSAFEFFRDESLNARNPNLVAANRPRPAGQINQFGGTFGGPFKKDKAFFFGAYDGQRSNLPNPVVLNSLPFAPAGVRTLLGPKVASYNIDRVQDTFLLKTDFNIDNKNQVWIRFNQQNFKGTNLENAGILSAQEHTGNSNVNTTSVTTGWTTSFSSHLFNEFRFQYSRDKEPGLANTNDPEATVVANAGGINDGTFNFGRNNFSPRETTIKRIQFINNQTLVLDKHTLKYGMDMLFDRIFNFFPGFFGGSYTFPSYAALDARTPSRFRQSFAGTGTTGATTHPDNNEYGFFLQDDFIPRPRLSLNFGIRYDYQQIAKPIVQNSDAALAARGFNTAFRPADKNNIAPRLGFSYALNNRTVFRGGYGIFYARTPAIMTGTAHSQNGIQVIAIDITCAAPGPVPCPTYPNVFASAPVGASAAPVNLYLFERNYSQPFTHQARFQFEREIFKGTTLSAGYTMFRGEDLSRTRNANLAAPVATTVQVFNSSGGNTGQTLTIQRFSNPRPILTYQRISLFESTARSFYQGLSVELNRRFSDKFQFYTSYVLSKAKDDKPDQTSVVVGTDDAKIAQNQFDLSGEYSRSDLDVRHRFIFSPVFNSGTFKHTENKVLRFLLSDYNISGILTAQSGFAYSAIVSGDPNADGNTANDRAPDTVRNQFSTPSTFQVDLRLARAINFGERFRITLLAEGFNLFNRANIRTVNNTLYAFSTAGGGRLTQTTNFGTPQNFLSGAPSFTFNSSYNREFQLGIRFDFF